MPPPDRSPTALARRLREAADRMEHGAARLEDGVLLVRTPMAYAALLREAAGELEGKAVVDRASALKEFTRWFVENYPGPRTIISNPEWHAPKIFRAAERALLAGQPTPAPMAAGPVGSPCKHPDECDEAGECMEFIAGNGPCRAAGQQKAAGQAPLTSDVGTEALASDGHSDLPAPAAPTVAPAAASEWPVEPETLCCNSDLGYDEARCQWCAPVVRKDAYATLRAFAQQMQREVEQANGSVARLMAECTRITAAYDAMEDRATLAERALEEARGAALEEAAVACETWAAKYDRDGMAIAYGCAELVRSLRALTTARLAGREE